MKYIRSTVSDEGCYPAPQSTSAPGLIPLTDEQAAMVVQYNGFVTITEETDEAGALSYKVEPNTAAWEAWKAAQPDPLDGEKARRIAKSKTDLAEYLETHPLQWTDGESYSITAEKQNQLMGTIASAQIDQKPPEWNSTGGVCREWTIEDLSALAVAIKDRVKALVKYQQTQEVAMRNAATQKALEAIVVDYDSVSLQEVSA